jgi:hypothetical protein
MPSISVGYEYCDLNRSMTVGVPRCGGGRRRPTPSPRAVVPRQMIEYMFNKKSVFEAGFAILSVVL